MTVAEEIEHIALEDGKVLDNRQSRAITHRLVDGWTGAKLAKAAGYSSVSTLNAFLQSKTGREGMRVGAIRLLAHAGAIGVSVALQLAQKAKSEKVRLDAAVALMDRAGISPQMQGQAQAQGKGGISISITMPSAALVAAEQAIDITPVQE